VQHRFIALNAYGAGNNGNYDNDDVSPVTSQHLKGASYVRLKHGSFVSISGFHGGMRNAEYYIEDAGMGVTIIDSSSEGSAHFLKSIDGNAAYTISVTVMGSRFAIEESVVGGVPQHDGLAADGRIIDWQRYGPLTINGLVVDGVKPSNVTGDPHFYINPASPIVGDHQPMHYDVSNVSVKAVGSSAWELFQINADTRLTTHGNVCFDTTPKGVPCTGLAAGTNDAIETAKNKNLSDASNTFPAGLTRDTEWDTAAEINAATTDDDLATLNGSQTVKNKTFDATNAFPSGLTSDSEWDTAAEINAATTDDDLATLNGTQTLKNKTFTDASNVFSATASVGFTVVAPGTGTKYCGPNSSVNDTTEANVSLRLPRGTLSNLYCKATVGPGTSGKTWRATIWKNASATTAFCDLTGNAAAATCTDSTHTVSIAAGDLVSIEVKKQAGSGSFNAANVGCTIDEKP
jgi:hypothetical protein